MRRPQQCHAAVGRDMRPQDVVCAQTPAGHACQNCAASELLAARSPKPSANEHDCGSGRATAIVAHVGAARMPEPLSCCCLFRTGEGKAPGAVAYLRDVQHAVARTGTPLDRRRAQYSGLQPGGHDHVNAPHHPRSWGGRGRRADVGEQQFGACPTARTTPAVAQTGAHWPASSRAGRCLRRVRALVSGTAWPGALQPFVVPVSR